MTREIDRQLLAAARAGDVSAVKRALAGGLFTKGAAVDVKGEFGRTALMLASSAAVAELLIARGAIVNARDDDGNQAIHVAAVNGFDAVVRFWLDRGVPVDVKGEFGRTALMKAGNAAVAELLIARGAAVDARDDQGNQAIHVAALNGRDAVVSFLLDRGVPVDVKGLVGRTALMQARNVAVVELLIARGAAADARDENGNQAVHIAAMYGNDAVIRFWLNKGVPIDARGAFGRTVLMQTGNVVVSGQWSLTASIQAKNVVVAELLIARGAAVDARDDRGNQAIHVAALNGKDAVVQFWLDRGVPLEMPGKFGRTALMMARTPAMAELLIARGANANAIDRQVDMAIHVAALEGWPEMVEFWVDKGMWVDEFGQSGCTALMMAANPATAEALIAKGAEVSAVSRQGDTALHIAALNGRTEMVRFWVGKGIPINAPGQHGCTALIMAANPTTAEVLITAGANVHARGAEGSTVIHVAVLNEWPEMVKFWLDRGVPIDVVDGSGRTPLMVATEAGKVSIAELLRSRSAIECGGVGPVAAAQLTAGAAAQLTAGAAAVPAPAQAPAPAMPGAPQQMIVPALAQIMATLAGLPDTTSVVGLIATVMPMVCGGPAAAYGAVGPLTRAIGELSVRADVPPGVIASLSSVLSRICSGEVSSPVGGTMPPGAVAGPGGGGGGGAGAGSGRGGGRGGGGAGSGRGGGGAAGAWGPGYGTDSLATKPAAGFWAEYYSAGVDQLLALRLAGTGVGISRAVLFDERRPGFGDQATLRGVHSTLLAGVGSTLGKFQKARFNSSDVCHPREGGDPVICFLDPSLRGDDKPVSRHNSTVVVPVLYRTSDRQVSDRQASDSNPAHWVGLVVTQSDDAYTVTYIDPENKPMPQALIDATLSSLPAGAVVNFGQKLVIEQSCSDNCGPELVEGLAELVTGSRVPEEFAAAAHSLLLEKSLTEAVNPPANGVTTPADDAGTSTAPGKIPVLHLEPASASGAIWSVNLLSDPWRMIGELTTLIQNVVDSIAPEFQTDAETAQLATLFELLGFFESGGFMPVPFGRPGRKPGGSDDPDFGDGSGGGGGGGGGSGGGGSGGGSDDEEGGYRDETDRGDATGFAGSCCFLSGAQANQTGLGSEV